MFKLCLFVFKKYIFLSFLLPIFFIYISTVLSFPSSLPAGVHLSHPPSTYFYESVLHPPSQTSPVPKKYIFLKEQKIGKNHLKKNYYIELHNLQSGEMGILFILRWLLSVTVRTMTYKNQNSRLFKIRWNNQN